jgi:hypothetical protein
MPKRSRLADHPKTGQIGPVFEWSIFPGNGHLNTGPFENWTFMSGFLA